MAAAAAARGAAALVRQLALEYGMVVAHAATVREARLAAVVVLVASVVGVLVPSRRSRRACAAGIEEDVPSRRPEVAVRWSLRRA